MSNGRVWPVAFLSVLVFSPLPVRGDEKLEQSQKAGCCALKRGPMSLGSRWSFLEGMSVTTCDLAARTDNPGHAFATRSDFHEGKKCDDVKWELRRRGEIIGE